MELISVIVPIYRVESYLDKCVESLVNQKDVQLEIILVDDGSPDRCPEMCELWAEKDSRIKVIHKMNGGLSDARNAGLEIANGNYIAFVDSDDWVDLKLYRTLLDAIKNTNSDIACCKIVKVCSGEFECVAETNMGAYELFDTQNGLFELISDGKIQQVVWNKLYKKSVLFNVWFEAGKYNEDEFWTFRVLGKANQTVVVDYNGYFYLQRNDSIMGTMYSTKRLDAVEAKTLRQEYLMQKFPTLAFVGKRNLLYTCLYHGQLVLRYLEKDEKRTALKKLEGIVNTYEFEKNELMLMSFKDRIWLSMSKICFKVTCRLRNLLKIGC